MGNIRQQHAARFFSIKFAYFNIKIFVWLFVMRDQRVIFWKIVYKLFEDNGYPLVVLSECVRS